MTGAFLIQGEVYKSDAGEVTRKSQICENPRAVQSRRRNRNPRTARICSRLAIPNSICCCSQLALFFGPKKNMGEMTRGFQDRDCKAAVVAPVHSRTPADTAYSAPSKMPASRRLPPELVSLIVTRTGDWELAHALGVRTSLPTPPPWLEFATPLDRAILRSGQAYSDGDGDGDGTVPVRYARAHGHTQFTQWGARVMLRFALVHTIEELFRVEESQFRRQCEHLLPVVASAWGRRNVLEWAKESEFKLNPDPRIMAEAIDEASRHGQVESEFSLGLGRAGCLNHGRGRGAIVQCAS